MVLAGALAACSFHLQTALDVPPEFARLYMETTDPNGDLSRALRRQLAGSNVELVADRYAATALLRIVAERSARRVLAVNARGRPIEYELSYSVTFEVLAGAGPLVPSQTVTLTRTLPANIDEPLAQDREAEILYDILRRDTARLILHRFMTAARAARQPAPAAE
ncbi:MAG TPA: LPS assembly lipoprotein LptE [Gammaproteobacteria bacterium]|nr:LPS assembly lipoprotein LptE [Gammaproteobacteria bacterium]